MDMLITVLWVGALIGGAWYLWRKYKASGTEE